jgi:hypothetical protein
VLALDGRLGGRIPDWFVVIQTAKYLGVDPWDLVERPHWINYGQAAMAAEHRAAMAKEKNRPR